MKIIRTMGLGESGAPRHRQRQHDEKQCFFHHELDLLQKYENFAKNPQKANLLDQIFLILHPQNEKDSESNIFVICLK